MRACLRRGLAASLFVYACTGLCALAAALPLARSVAAPAENEAANVELLLVAVRLGYAAGTPGPWAFVPLALTLLGAPLLRSLWLRALAQPGRLHEHASAAVSGYEPALIVSAMCAGYVVLTAGCACLLAAAVWFLFGFTRDVGLQTSAAILVASPCLLVCALHAPSLNDVAQLQLALGERQPRRALRAALTLIDRRVLGARAGLWFAQALVTGLALSARLWLGSSTSATLGNALLGQLLMLAQVGLRGLWLAWLTTRAGPAHAT